MKIILILSLLALPIYAKVSNAEKKIVKDDAKTLLLSITKLKREQENKLFALHLEFIKKNHEIQKRKIETEFKLLSQKEIGNDKLNAEIESQYKKYQDAARIELKNTREEYLNKKMQDLLISYSEKISKLTKDFRAKVKKIQNN